MNAWSNHQTSNYHRDIFTSFGSIHMMASLALEGLQRQIWLNVLMESGIPMEDI
jgi:hypothetical protein